MSPRVITRLGEYRSACDDLRAQGGLALVPTMGALHDGHAALIGHAARIAAGVAVTIFVNPTQFGPNEDFNRYPRDLERDVATCGQAGAHLVFAPQRSEMYPSGEATRVQVARLSETLCGPWRPGHFEGVATIVTKLLSATGSCRAVFGRKDYQQLQIIRRLATDLLLPVEVVDHATVRDGDGLAMSSRNRYLSAPERARALAIPRALSRVGARFAAGERAAPRLLSELQVTLAQSDIQIEYASLAHSADLHLISEGEVMPGEAGVFVAARVGATRLIDNIILGVDPLPTVAGP